MAVKAPRDLRQTATRAEQKAWALLRGRRVLGLKFRRQHPIGRYTADFYCFDLRLAVELDGSVHSQPDQVRKDCVKDAHLRRQGIQVLRIPNGQVLEDPEGFVRKIQECAALTWLASASHPLPKGEG